MTEQNPYAHIVNTATLEGFGDVLILLAPDLKDKSNRNSLLEAFPFQEVIGPNNIREKGEPRFACTVVLTRDQKKALEPAAKAAARQKWPDVDLSTLAFPFKSGDKVAEKRETKGKDGTVYAGKVLLNPKSYENRFDPSINVAILKDGEVVMHKDWAAAGIKDSELYSGMRGHVKIAFSAFKGQREGDKDGVTVYLQSVIKTKDGDRIGGSTAASDFSAVAGRETDYDPTSSDDEDIVVE